ncbi:MAG: ParB N-terminal domain-containing protein [Treponema sp.]|nr:ParB N-terminal domain-containing protein [Treponema sp.]
MAKTLNFNLVGENIPFACGDIKFSKQMSLEKIEEHADFKNLYKIDKGVLERIVDSMKKHGFDKSQPVHVWKHEGHNYLIDGYTRYTACGLAGITQVPVYEHEFESFDETYKYVLGLQVNRRNLEGDELLRNVALLTKCDFVKNAKGEKAKAIADLLGVGKRTAIRAMIVEKKADSQMRERIDKGEITVNQAYNELHKKEDKPDELIMAVKKIAYYILAEVDGGFTPDQLLKDEDFKDALNNPLGFEIPESDIQVMSQKGIDELILRWCGKNKKRRKDDKKGND